MVIFAKRGLFLLFFMLIYSSVQAEPTFSAHLKIGYPNFIGISGDYALPWYYKKLSVYTDITFFPLSLKSVTKEVEKLDLKLAYYSIGARFSFNGQNNGFFIGTGYANFQFGGKAYGLKGDGYVKDDPLKKSVSYINGTSTISYAVPLYEISLGFRQWYDKIVMTFEFGNGFTALKKYYPIFVQAGGKTYCDEFKTPFMIFPKITLSAGYCW